ncbi:SdrD B-like domain-containing protein [Curtobacterium sp. RRHDQ10]|uniref:SdrD B-like domain-containing protein n=1 Tax=Curtobacterium phyllosphaerae TaxID=3413379 RepID=UPI003BF07FF4
MSRRTRGCLAALMMTALVVGASDGAMAVPLAAPADHPVVAADAPLVIALTSSGTAPFTTDAPGGDVGPGDDVVRTNDSLTYEVTVRADRDEAPGAHIVLTLPGDATFSSMPNACGAGSENRGSTLVCELGSLEPGAVRSLPVVVSVSGPARNGDRVVLSGTLTRNGADVATAVAPPVRVSAAPRYDLTKDAVAPIVRPGVVGPDGSTIGYTTTYPIGVTWRPIVPDDNRLLGFEQLSGDLSFTDDVSRMTGGSSSETVLFPGDGGSACGPNTLALFPALPGGSGGGARNVRDSGTITCSQSAPGAPVTVRISGTDTAITPTGIPTENQNGGPIVGGVAAHVVEGFVRLWSPFPAQPDGFDAIDTFSTLDAHSVSGQANVDDPANNRAVLPMIAESPGTGYKTYRRALPGGSSADNSARTGNPWVTAGAPMRSDVGLRNTGLTRYDRAVLCDVFDNRYQRVQPGPGIDASATVDGFAGRGRIQYAARSWTTPADAQAQRCADGDARWYDAPGDVPGGAAMIGMVRAVGALDGGSTARLATYLGVLDAPQGTRVRNFGSFSTDGGTTWRGDETDPDFALGGMADHLVVTTALARIDKRVVDPGTDPETTKDRTAHAEAGTTVRFALYPSLTSFARPDDRADVRVVDSLPTGTGYVDGSGSIAPTSVEDVDGPSGTTQRVTWVVRDVRPGRTIAPIAYDVAIGAGVAPGGQVVNTAEVSSPLDVSDPGIRQATRGLQIIAGSGVTVDKRAVEPVVVLGDGFGWTLGVTNSAARALDGVDLVDVLPADGDGNSSSFTGRLRLDAAPAGTADGDTVRYTARPPRDVSLDPRDPSNAADGSTVWCAAEALGTDGCPTDLGAATAVRIVRGAPIAPGATVTFGLHAVASDARVGDRVVNRFGLAADGLVLTTTSGPARIDVVAGAIGDRVWDDRDRNGLQDDGEPGVGGVRVELTGVDDTGTDTARSTVSDEHGAYRFDRLRPGAYRVCVAAPDGATFTTPRVGADRTRDSDVGPDGCSDRVVLERVEASGRLVGVTQDMSVDAGLVADEVGEVVVPVRPEVGTGPSASAGGTAPDGTPPGPGQRMLAFTGPAGTSAIVLLVLALGAVGVGGLLRRARRAEHGAGGRAE